MVFFAFLNAEIFLLIYIFFLFGCFWIKRGGCQLGVLKHSGCVLGFLYVCQGVDRTFYSSHKPRNRSRYEFLVLFIYPKDTSFYIISSLDLLKPLGYVFCFCLQLSVRADLHTGYINVGVPGVGLVLLETTSGWSPALLIFCYLWHSAWNFPGEVVFSALVWTVEWNSRWCFHQAPHPCFGLWPWLPDPRMIGSSSGLDCLILCFPGSGNRS